MAQKNHKVMGPAVKKKQPAKQRPKSVPATEVPLQKSSKTNSTFMPILSINKLKFAGPSEQLPISNDPALLSAIEQTQDEFEEDEQLRELAVRILNAFKTRNSVEALSQVALYDLSSNLRSKS